MFVIFISHFIFKLAEIESLLASVLKNAQPHTVSVVKIYNYTHDHLFNLMIN